MVAKKPTRPAPRIKAGEEVYLRAWRKKKRKSLEWVASEIGSDKGTLSEIETRDGPAGVRLRGRWLYDYARALGLSTDQLLRHPDTPPTVGELVREAPPDLQEHIRGIVAAISRTT